MTSSETREFSEYQSAGDDTPLSLVAALRRGSDRAWGQLAQIWGRTIYQFCKTRKLKHEDCEEIVQAVLVKMYRYISEFQRDGKQMRLRHWAFTIVRREIATHCDRYLRKPGSPGGEDYQRIMREIQSEDETEESGTTFRNQLVSNILESIRSDFDPKVWQAFEMFSVQEIDGPTVANRLGMSPNAVRQAAHRVRRRLKNELEGVLVARAPEAGSGSGESAAIEETLGN
ncbi:MAG: sigma-70 family RNA polymerase sigma factor [Planctomycetales bacterium]|nr:sigma-70 family RNA polymerase sigma factor [Planctomycetales bacterium]